MKKFALIFLSFILVFMIACGDTTNSLSSDYNGTQNPTGPDKPGPDDSTDWVPIGPPIVDPDPDPDKPDPEIPLTPIGPPADRIYDAIKAAFFDKVSDKTAATSDGNLTVTFDPYDKDDVETEGMLIINLADGSGVQYGLWREYEEGVKNKSEALYANSITSNNEVTVTISDSNILSIKRDGGPLIEVGELL